MTALNDDCLLRICCLLDVREQFLLLQLHTRLRRIVLHLWQRKYANEFDWAEQLQQGRRLSDAMQRKLLRVVAPLTRSLLNLRPELLARKRKRMPRIESISFRQCTAKLLRELPAMCNNLQQLQLQGGRGVTHAQLAQLLAGLPQLTHFELQPGEAGRSCTGSRLPKEARPTTLNLPQTLETLKLPACALRAAATEIARLPQLRHLTAFLCDCGDDDEQPNDANALTTATVCACLKALKEQATARGKVADRRQGASPRAEAAGATPLACQIVALNFHCQLDPQLPRLLQGQLSDVVRLERFAWHSRLILQYDFDEGWCKWIVQHPSVAHAMNNFLVSQAGSLRELDFTGNVYATTFVAPLMQRLDARRGSKAPYSLWYNGCPRPQAAAVAKGTCNESDLPRVELELKRLTNAKATEAN